MTKHLIIDLDSILYKAGFSTERTWRSVTIAGEDKARARFGKAADMKVWLGENGFLPGDYTIDLQHEVDVADRALVIFDSMLESIVSKYPEYTPELYMGGRAQYRYNLYPDYKVGRLGAKKPVHYDMLYQHALVKGAVVPEHYEADDVCCIRAYECMEAGVDYVIARIDKDLAQIPGVHYNYATSEETTIDPYEADYNFYTQLLTGDTGDSIPGLKGVGPKTAIKLLEDCQDERDMYQVCCDAYESKKVSSDEMVRNAQLLYLLRSEDDSYKPPI